MFKTVVVAAVMCLAAGAAVAQEWYTKTEEDVFSGKTTAVMIGGSNPQQSLYFRCTAEREVSVSFIFQFEGDMNTSLKGLLVLKADSGETYRFDASAYQHNTKYGGFVVQLEGEDKAKVLKAVGGAKKKVLAGLAVDAIDYKVSIDLPATGSGRAAGQFMKACEIS